MYMWQTLHIFDDPYPPKHPVHVATVIGVFEYYVDTQMAILIYGPGLHLGFSSREGNNLLSTNAELRGAWEWPNIFMCTSHTLL